MTPKCPDCKRDQDDCICASPASAPKGFKHDIGADRFTVVHGSYWWHVRAGEGTQNIGKFHTKRAAEEMALTLLTAFRDGAFMQYQAMLAAAPAPPVSEDRKDAERYRWLRKHGAGFVELAISVDEDGIAQRGARIEQIPEMLDAAIDAAMYGEVK